MKNQSLPTTNLNGSAIVEIHFKRPLFSEMKHINCAESAVETLRHFINPNTLDVKEFFWVILMSQSNRVLAVSEVSVGTTIGVQINSKEILQLALLTNAQAIILAHNHPSGHLKISDSDIRQTEKFKKVAKCLEINVLDHIIITSESFIAFSQEREI